MKKGFTLVELLIVIVIVALLAGIGIFTYNNVFKLAEGNYYEILENDLILAANDYFQDHRDELPINSYNSVLVEDLVSLKYSEVVRDKNDNTCGGSVFIFRNDDKYDYEVCLVCEDYQSSGLYCRGDNEKNISISAITSDTHDSYNVLVRNPQVIDKQEIIVTFSMEVPVSKYRIIKMDNNYSRDCDDIVNKSCTINFRDSGTYLVSAYDSNGKKIGRDKYFYMNINWSDLSFQIIGQPKYLIEGNDRTKDIEFKIENITQNVKSIEYKIDELEYQRIDSYKINISLYSGEHVLMVRVTNEKDEELEIPFVFYVTYLINLDYGDSIIKQYEVVKGKNYGYLYADEDLAVLLKVINYNLYKDSHGLPKVYGGKSAVWRYNGSIVTDTSDVTLDYKHTLNLDQYTVVDDENLSRFCYNDLIYNGEEQDLTDSENSELIFENNKRTRAGTQAVTVKLKDGMIWKSGGLSSKTIDCTIAKRNVTVTATNQSKNYDGVSLNANNNCTGNGEVSGHTIICSNSGTITNAGTTPKILGNVLIKNGSVDVSDNYEISKVNGVLTVNKINSVITCLNPTYNGVEQIIATCSGGTINDATMIYHNENGGYKVTCTGDNNHADSEKNCNINPIQYTVTFDINGASKIDNKTTNIVKTCFAGISGSSCDVLTPSITRTNYSVCGWSNNKVTPMEIVGEQMNFLVDDVNTNNNATTLYAITGLTADTIGNAKKVTSGAGLWNASSLVNSKEGTKYVYRGANPNNYIAFNCTDENSHTGCVNWRILSIEKRTSTDSQLVMEIVNTTPTVNSKWATSGSATYNNSLMKTEIDKYYNETIKTAAKKFITPASYYYQTLTNGNMNVNDGAKGTPKIISGVERGVESQYNIGIPRLSDYMITSTSTTGDTQLGNSPSNVASSNNWLKINGNQYFISRRTSSLIIFGKSDGKIDYGGSGQNGTGNAYYGLPVVHLNNNVFLIGNGTSDDQYYICPACISKNSCTITTPSGFADSKLLTIETTSDVTYSFDGITYGEEKTKLVSGAGVYRGYIKDKTTGLVSSCSIEIKKKTVYQHQTCSSCNSCKHCKSGYVFGGGNTWCYGGTKVNKPEGECSDDGWNYNTRDGMCYSRMEKPETGPSCSSCQCGKWNTSDTTWYDDSCGDSNYKTCKDLRSKEVYGL